MTHPLSLRGGGPLHLALLLRLSLPSLGLLGRGSRAGGVLGGLYSLSASVGKNSLMKRATYALLVLAGSHVVDEGYNLLDFVCGQQIRNMGAFVLDHGHCTKVEPLVMVRRSRTSETTDGQYLQRRRAKSAEILLLLLLLGLLLGLHRARARVRSDLNSYRNKIQNTGLDIPDVSVVVVAVVADAAG